MISFMMMGNKPVLTHPCCRTPFLIEAGAITGLNHYLSPDNTSFRKGVYLKCRYCKKETLWKIVSRDNSHKVIMRIGHQ